MSPSSKNALEQLSEEVFKHRPVLPSILERFGHLSIRDYIVKAVTSAGDQIPTERKRPVIEALRAEATRLYGDAVGDQAARQLERYYAVSTADHHGPIVHSSFTSADIALSLPATVLPDYMNAIVFAGSAVSMANPSFPGGFLISTNSGSAPERLSLFAAKERDFPVFGHAEYGQEHLTRVLDRIDSLCSRGAVSSPTAQRASAIVNETFGSASLLKLTSYDDQISVANRSFFNQMLADKPSDKPGLVYLSLAHMTRRLLLDHHLKEATIISKILFDPATRREAQTVFDGTFGGFTMAEKKGTFFFWGWSSARGRNRRVALWEENGFLRSADGAISIALTPEAVTAAVEQKELIPSTLLEMLVIPLFHGLACFGGTHQVNYLTDMRERYLKLLDQIPDATSGDRAVATAVAPDWLIPYRLAFMGHPDGHYRPAGGLDLAISESADGYNAACLTAANITLGDSIMLHLPELYCILRYGSWQETEDAPARIADVIASLDMGERIHTMGVLPQ